MKLQDALVLLEQGKYISRECWQEIDGYLVLMKGMKHIWKILITPNPNAGNHIFSYPELIADDWIEYDEARFLPPIIGESKL